MNEMKEVINSSRLMVVHQKSGNNKLADNWLD